MIEELIKYLNEEFDAVFEFKVTYLEEAMSMGFEVYMDGKFLTKIVSPQETYDDILYMFGGLRKDAFYNDIIAPNDYELPSGFNNPHEFAMNEVKEIYKQSIQKFIK